MAGVVAGAGCGSSGSGAPAEDGGACIVLANGGNKLCGGDARAWCDSTDAIRGASGDTGDLGLDATVDESQRVCDDLRAQGP